MLVSLAVANKIKAGQADDLPCHAPEYIIGNYRNWLKTELPDYWQIREKIIYVLDFLAALRRVSVMTYWEKDAEAAQLLAGAIRNDHI